MPTGGKKIRRIEKILVCLHNRFRHCPNSFLLIVAYGAMADVLEKGNPHLNA